MTQIVSLDAAKSTCQRSAQRTGSDTRVWKGGRHWCRMYTRPCKGRSSRRCERRHRKRQKQDMWGEMWRSLSIEMKWKRNVWGDIDGETLKMHSWKELRFGRGDLVHGNPCWVTDSPEGLGLGMNPQKGRNRPTENAACGGTEVVTSPERLGPMKGPLPGQGNPEVYSNPWMLHTGAQEIIKKWEAVEKKSKMQRAPGRNGCALTSTSCIAHCLSKRSGKDCMYCATKARETEPRNGEGRWWTGLEKTWEMSRKVGFFLTDCCLSFFNT